MGVFLDSPWTGQNFSPPTPVDIATIEAAIVAQLESYLGAALGTQMIEVTHFPDKPEAYEMRHRIGVAMVIYMGATTGRSWISATWRRSGPWSSRWESGSAIWGGPLADRRAAPRRAPIRSSRRCGPRSWAFSRTPAAPR